MAKRPNVTDGRVRELLERHQCPLPFYTVRTRMLGSVASLDPLMTPMRAVESLWGGELPVLDSTDDVNELLSALVMGLWNQLAEHQKRSTPFRLTRVETPATREGVATLALMRSKELKNFWLGVFGNNEVKDLPERAHNALMVLTEMRAMLEGLHEFVNDPDKELSPEGSADLIRRFRDLTKRAEQEIHEAVLSCTRARRNSMQRMPPGRPVFH
jgi:hypothetical protein